MNFFETPGPFRDRETIVAATPDEANRKGRLDSLRIRMDLYMIVEIAAVAAMGVLASRVYVYGVLGLENYLSAYLLPILLLPMTLGVILRRSGLYQIGALNDFVGSFGKITAGVLGAFAIIALASVILGVSDEYSRLWFGFWLASSLPCIWLMRALGTHFFSKMTRIGRWQKRAILIGQSAPISRLAEKIAGTVYPMKIVSLFGKASGHAGDALEDELETFVDQAQTMAVDTVIIVPNYDEPEQLEKILNAVSMLSAEIKVVPPSAFANLPLLGVSKHDHEQFIDVQHSRVTDWGRMFKLLEDYVVAALAVATLSWLFLLIAALIKLESPGPVLFKQSRTGLNNRIFSIYKFRTMVHDSESRGFEQTKTRDPRITFIGRILRRTSLDELPQLLNVLRGEMSIVGPRPHPVELNEAYQSQVWLFNKRHSVKPGITGWAQIHDHRGPIDSLTGMQQRLHFDLYYVDNWSIWFDIKIIATTPFMTLIHKNAI